MFCIYIILAYIEIVVNLCYTLRVFVSLYFSFCYFAQTLLIILGSFDLQDIIKRVIHGLC